MLVVLWLKGGCSYLNVFFLKESFVGQGARLKNCPTSKVTQAPPRLKLHQKPKFYLRTMESDPFDDLLSLEDRFYNEGFQLGTTDGVKAGRIEGRVFGLEKGFEKYVEMGILHGKSLVWAGRLSNNHAPTTEVSRFPSGVNSDEAASSFNKDSSPSATLPSLPSNPRLGKHIKILYALTEPVSLSTENSEDTVSDFDDRLKRAIGKAKIVEKLVGEEGFASASGAGANSGLGSRQNANDGGDSNIEDMSVLKARH
jgi:hypothetical protein